MICPSPKWRYVFFLWLKDIKKTWDFFSYRCTRSSTTYSIKQEKPTILLVSVLGLFIDGIAWNCRSFVQSSISKNAFICRIKILSLNYNYSLSPHYPPFLRLINQFVSKDSSSFCFDKIIFWFFFGSFRFLISKFKK